MITYIYVAKNTINGERVRAEVQAESEEAAARLLMAQNLIPITITTKSSKNFLSKLTNRVTPKDRILFTRQLSTLINAGLPLAQSLRSVGEQIDNKGLLDVVGSITAEVEGGTALATAFAHHPKIFNQIYVNLVAAGEASGSLDKALERIAIQQEKDATVTSKIRGALLYPAIVLVVIGGVLIFMLTTVLPQIKQLYVDLNAELPFLTTVLVGISSFIINFWWVLILVLAGGGYILFKYLQTDAGRLISDKVKLKFPLLGKLYMKLYMARFCRIASVLLGSGLPMLEALKIAEDSVNNVYVARSITKAIGKVRGGKALSVSLTNDPNFMTLVPQMIKIGEDSGTIDKMLERTAIYYEDELDNAVKNLSATIEPILMIVLGLVVGVIVAAILLPVYGLIGANNTSSAGGPR